MTFSNPIVGGVTLIRPAIQSPDYIAGSSGWSINKDGSAEFNDVTIRGDGNGDALIVGPDNGPQVQVGSTASSGYIQLPTNRPIEGSVAEILAGVLNQGAVNEAASLQILGPTVVGAADRARLFLNSQNNDGSSQSSASITYGSGLLIMDENTYTAQNTSGTFSMGSGQFSVSGPRLVIDPDDTPNSAVFVTLAGTYPGNLFRIDKGAKTPVLIPVDGRLLLSPDASASSAIFVNADAGYTGNLLRLSENNVDAFRVANDGSVTSTGGATFATDVIAATGQFDDVTAGNIQRGVEAVTTVASQWVEVVVNFPQAFATTPTVVVSGNNNAPAVGGTTQLYSAATSITTTGFTLRVFRSTAITMNFGWIAIA